MIQNLARTLRQSALVKVFALLLIWLLLCIPLGSIEDLVRDRGDSQLQAEQELAATHTGAQTVTGPFIVLPYVEHWSDTERDSKGAVTRRVQSKARTVVVFPQQLKIDGELKPEERYRGLFRVLFYKIGMSLEGQFAPVPAAPRPSEREATLVPGLPVLAFSVTDVRGIEGLPEATLGGVPLKFAHGIPGLKNAPQGIHASLPPELARRVMAGELMDFKLSARLVGQRRLEVVPAAGDTQAHIASPWPHPSFGGRFLPVERSISDAGFDAQWRISSLVSRARAQMAVTWGAELPTPDSVPADFVVAASTTGSAEGAARELDTLGVVLAQPVNIYFMAHRAAKYGALVIGLVLMASFMVELLRRVQLHPIQYGLVGLSIALFFLLLLALSEKLSFWIAYVGSAAASVVLLTTYFSAILRGWTRGVTLGGFVATLYGALYILLASEGNALLLGSLLTFGMMAGLMLVTRKIDWYSLGSAEAAPLS